MIKIESVFSTQDTVERMKKKPQLVRKYLLSCISAERLVTKMAKNF
jgi:hypothetical protein